MRNDAETDWVEKLPPDLAPMSDRWAAILRGEHPLRHLRIPALEHRAGARRLGREQDRHLPPLIGGERHPPARRGKPPNRGN